MKVQVRCTASGDMLAKPHAMLQTLRVPRFALCHGCRAAHFWTCAASSSLQSWQSNQCCEILYHFRTLPALSYDFQMYHNVLRPGSCTADLGELSNSHCALCHGLRAAWSLLLLISNVTLDMRSFIFCWNVAVQ